MCSGSGICYCLLLSPHSRTKIFFFPELLKLRLPVSLAGMPFGTLIVAQMPCAHYSSVETCCARNLSNLLFRNSGSVSSCFHQLRFGPLRRKQLQQWKGSEAEARTPNPNLPELPHTAPRSTQASRVKEEPEKLWEGTEAQKVPPCTSLHG